MRAKWRCKRWNRKSARRDEIRAKFEAVEITGAGDGAIGQMKAVFGMLEKRHLLEPGGDHSNELDMYHHAQMLSEGMSSDEGAELLGIMLELRDLGHELEAMTYGDPPEKVYKDPAQVAEDLWMPLVREGIIPETYVDDDYSEVRQTFAEAATLYEERLAKYTEEMGKWDAWAENTEFLASCAKAGFDIAAEYVGAKEAIDLMSHGVAASDLADNAQYQAALKTVETLQLIGTAIGAVGAGTKKAIVDKDVFASLDGFTKAVSDVVTVAAGSGPGKAVGSVMTAVIHGYPLAKRMKTWRETGAWDWAGFVGDLSDAVSSGIAAGDGSSDKDTYKNIAEAVKAGFAIIKTGVEVVEADDEERVLSVIAAKIGAASAAIAKAIVEIQKEKETEAALQAAESEGDLSKEEKDAIKERIKDEYETALTLLEAGDSLDDIGEALETKTGAMREAAEAFDEAEAERLKDASEASQAQAMKEFMETPDDVFQAMLASGFGLDVYDADSPDPDDSSQEAIDSRAQAEERRLKSLESIIAIQKKHEATYELGKTIVSTAATVAKETLSTVIPGLGVASVATQMIYAFMEAAKQGREFLVWQANVADASAAHTVQLEAILNRHGLAKRQKTEAGIAAALAAAKLVGEVLKLAGHAAPAGYAISAAATSAAALAAVASKGITKAQMASAWSTYKEALANPQDRFLARKALRSNPTLAKYAMAYGAIEEGNPIAKEVMRRCGLNETTLMDTGTNVSKVVEFLELRFKDDPILLRASPSPKAWYPGEIELRATSWTRFIFAAQNEKLPETKQANPLLGSCDVTGVAASLATFEEKSAAVASASSGDNDAKTAAYGEAIRAAERLDAAFTRFNPVEKENTAKTHAEVQEYATAMLARCMAQKELWVEEKASVDAELREAAKTEAASNAHED